MQLMGPCSLTWQQSLQQQHQQLLQLQVSLAQLLHRPKLPQRQPPSQQLQHLLQHQRQQRQQQRHLLSSQQQEQQLPSSQQQQAGVC
jgi:hypothetical protein